MGYRGDFSTICLSNVILVGGGGGVTHIWDMGYWGVKNLGYGI